MRRFVFSFIALAGLEMAAASTPAYADADDAAWIKQCMADNRYAGPGPDVVAAYCSCMNQKMPDDEERSISEWAKINPEEAAICRKEAGWD